MKILCFNQNWFADEWRAEGHEVVTCGMRYDLDYQFETPLVHLDRIIDGIPGGTAPDLIVHHDNSMPVLLLGFEETALRTVFYSVDAHHHIDEHKYYSRIFDHTFVAQRDYIPEFIEVGGRSSWLPLWASRVAIPVDERTMKSVFVGNLDPKLHPERVEFFRALGEKIEIEYRMGEWWDIFPHAEIVINQTVKGDLNFRVFEGMSSGAVLLTERIENGLSTLFTDGEHLVTYARGDVDEAAHHVRALLENRNSARRIGAAGREEILAHHTPRHRAQELLRISRSLAKSEERGRFFPAMMTYLLTSKRLYDHRHQGTVTAIIASLKAASHALLIGEHLSEEMATHAVLACYHYDRLIEGGTEGRGMKLLSELAAAYPNYPILELGFVRSLLSGGLLDEAHERAHRLLTDTGTIPGIFSLAEEAIGHLLHQLYGEEETASTDAPAGVSQTNP